MRISWLIAPILSLNLCALLAAQVEGETPVATETDVVLVEASLPYVPTSNTIATRLPTDLASTPANVGVVSGPLIEEQRNLILSQALENVSGVNVQSGQGVFDFFVVRGFDSLSSVLVLTDGAPEPEVTYYQMYNTARVELFKGPAGFLYGPRPISGAVNIVRKQPVLSDFADVSVAAGSFSTYEGAIDVNQASASGELAFRLNGLWRQTDGYRDGREGEVAALNPAFAWRPSEKTTLSFNLEVQSLDFLPDAGLPLVGGELADAPRERSFASPLDRSEQGLSRFQFDFEHRLSEKTSLRNKTYYRQLDWLSNGTLLGFVIPTPDNSLAVTRSLLLLDDLQDFYGNQFEIVWMSKTGPIDHRLVTGIEVARFDDRYTLDVALLPPIDIFSPVETAEDPPFIIPGLSAAGDSESQVIAPYLIDEIVINPRLQFLVGLRYDSIDFEDAVSETSRSDGELSPLLGVVFRPVEALSLYGNFAQSFAPPSPRVSGERQPEESQQIEIGARQELLNGRMRLTMALFEIERKNIAIPDDNGFTQQAGNQRSRGFELEVAMELAKGWRGLVVYGYTESVLTEFTERILVSLQPPTEITVDRSGNQASFAPDHVARLWLSKEFFDRLTLAGGLRYVGEQFIAEDNVTALDDYLLIDLAAIYGLGNWQFSVHLENLTDADYETRGFGSWSVIPGKPVSAHVRMQYRF